MFKSKASCFLAVVLGFSFLGSIITQADDPDKLVREALSAAPESIAAIATVKNWDGTVLKAGSPDWVCYPSMPDREGLCPMCLDKPWQEWMDAMLAGTEPKVSGVGVSYMLQGDCAVSNIDPMAMHETPDNEWVREGPHLMIVTPDRESLKGKNTNPYSGTPYVMWRDTPFAHIMVPLPAGE